MPEFAIDPMSSLRRPLMKTLGTLVMVFFLPATPHGGFMLYLILPCFGVWTIFNVVGMVKKPEERRLRAWRMAIWVFAFTSVGSLHWYWRASARTNAEAAVALIEAYKTRTGTFPATLDEVGVPRDGMRLLYFNDEHGPRLAYLDPFQIFTTFDYDFERRTWSWNPD